MKYDVAIIGAGASGLMLASLLHDKKVCLIDANNSIGAKIRVSGGGKCNITNKYVTTRNYLGDEDFVQPILDAFDEKAFLSFCKANGLVPHFDEKIVKGTYFCKSSKEVINLFDDLTKHCRYYLDTKVLAVNFDESYHIKTTSKTIEATNLVVASGGLSFTNLGASSIAFDIAKQFNHKVNVLSPALVGFTVQKEQFWFKKLSGISCMVRASVEGKTFEGSMLFAHKGCSGPVILNSSLYWKKGQISLDFLSGKKLEQFLKGNKKLSSALPLPKRFIQEFLASLSIEDKAVSTLSNEEKEKLKSLTNYSFSPAGNFGYSKAEVTRGGVSTLDVNPYTMESNLQPNLYFLGECLDVTGELGGYNFQFAWSSAYVCSQDLTVN